MPEDIYTIIFDARVVDTPETMAVLREAVADGLTVGGAKILPGPEDVDGPLNGVVLISYPAWRP